MSTLLKLDPNRNTEVANSLVISQQVDSHADLNRTTPTDQASDWAGVGRDTSRLRGNPLHFDMMRDDYRDELRLMSKVEKCLHGASPIIADYFVQINTLGEAISICVGGTNT